MVITTKTKSATHKDQQPPLTPKQAPFRTRKTMADLVREGMILKKRKTYYHRIVLLTEHKNFSNEFIPNLKEEFKRITIIANNNILREKITGFVLYYSQYSAIMLAGIEQCISKFLKELAQIEDNFFSKTFVIVYAKNINQIYFKEIIWKTGEPPILLETFSDMGIPTIKRQHSALVEQLFNLWAQIHDDLESGVLTNVKEWLTTRYAENMPILIRIEYVLSSKNIYSLSEVVETINVTPQLVNYSEKVWPAPDDYIPKNIIDLGPYDVNLLYPDYQTM